jgi:3-hydroxyacyl-CoA dehydrogenase / enoyl-CoA hydratase / 3-hydroxybutyryl-CoA epimerase
VVAAIHGYCLGGGLELAMACHYRIATRDDATRLGLPEVNLGIFPGFNGTVRAIKLAGPVAGMDMMLRGSMLRATAAKAIGIVDELVPARANLHWAARKAVLQNKKSNTGSITHGVMRQWPARGYLAGEMRKKVAEKAREEHLPAPFRLIELFEQFGGDDAKMKAAETRFFAPLMVSEQSRNLRRVFRLSEQMKAQAPKGSEFKPKRAHVIGAGTMGADIAGVLVLAGMEVSLQDLNAEQLGKAQQQCKNLFRKRLKSKTEQDAALSRLILDQAGEHVPRADVVIEAIVEKLEVKQALFKSLEPRMKPGAVMATNTSSLLIEKIAEPLADPGRLIGLHFFNPVPALPLVEVIKGTGTREEEIRKGCGVVTALGKYPLVVKSVPGFLVNRVLMPYLAGAMARLESGTPREKIDEAARTFGMPVGPIELADQVGLDICKHVADIIGGTSSVPQDSQLGKLVAAGKLGKKSGEGFYSWKDGKPVKTETATPFDKGELETLGRELVEPLIAECERCVAEGVVESADMVDAGVIFGTGFAPFRGGPLNYKASQQAKAAVAPEVAA